MVPSFSAAMVRSRTACGMSPLMAAAANPRALSLLGDFLGGLFGADEHDHRVALLDLQQTGQRVHLPWAVHLDVALGDVLRRLRLRLDRHLDRVVQVLAGDLADGGRHGRREQRDLLVFGGVGEDAFDVLGEAHLKHLVGLVEHQVVEVGEVEAALLEVIDHPARRADDDLCAAFEPAQSEVRRGRRRRSAARSPTGARRSG